MTPSAPRETPQQASQRRLAQREQKLARKDNIRSIQDQLTERTDMFRRVSSPRVSLVNGQVRR